MRVLPSLVLATTTLLSLSTFPLQRCAAQDETPLYENDSPKNYPINTGAISDSTATAADIIKSLFSEQTRDILIRKVAEDLYEVYANNLLVEKFANTTASIGTLTAVASDTLTFTPTGRPALTCPLKQENWFGPCRASAS